MPKRPPRPDPYPRHHGPMRPMSPLALAVLLALILFLIWYLLRQV